MIPARGLKIPRGLQCSKIKFFLKDVCSRVWPGDAFESPLFLHQLLIAYLGIKSQILSK